MNISSRLKKYVDVMGRTLWLAEKCNPIYNFCLINKKIIIMFTLG